MIVEFLLGVFANVQGWILSFLPAFSVSGLNAGIAAMLGPFADGVNQLGAWIPWSTVQIVLPISIGLYVSGLTLRAVKSLIPTISG